MTDIHTYRHTYIQTYIHADIQTYIHAYIHTDIHIYRHTYSAYIYTEIHTDKQINRRAPLLKIFIPMIAQAHASERTWLDKKLLIALYKSKDKYV